MKYFDARSSTITDEKAGYHRFDPDLTIAGQPLQYLDDGDFRYLGRPTNVHGSEELARSTITSKLDEWLQLVDNQTLPNTSKLWLYQHFIIPKLSRYLTALDLTLTFVKRLQAKATKYLKKWSGLPRSANTAILFLGKSGRAGLHITSIVTYWKQMQLVRLDILKHSADVRCCRLYDNLLQRQSTWSRKFPAAVNFYSSLTDESISDSDYQHAQEVWTTFNCQTIGDYHDLYLQTDVLLLADVFENFRRTALSTYKLDPAHYYTLPGYSWDALLKLTNVSLELLTEPDIYLFVEKGLRGGISMVSHRHAQANNPQMQNYNPDQPTSFLQYLDSNNLYGWAMSQYLPTGSFQLVNYTDQILETPADADRGFILEVDLEYPASLHRQHNDYPLAPEKMKVTNTMMSPYQQKLIDELGVSISCEKLVPNLMNKSRYVVHYRNLQLYLSLGLKLTKVHKVLQFQQSPWMAPYITKNTELRKTATNDFEKDFYKLMNNAVSHSWISVFSLFQISANFVKCPARLLLDRSLFLFRFLARRWKTFASASMFGCSDLTRRNESLGELHGLLLSDKRSLIEIW